MDEEAIGQYRLIQTGFGMAGVDFDDTGGVLGLILNFGGESDTVVIGVGVFLNEGQHRGEGIRIRCPQARLSRLCFLYGSRSR